MGRSASISTSDLTSMISRTIAAQASSAPNTQNIVLYPASPSAVASHAPSVPHLPAIFAPTSLARSAVPTPGATDESTIMIGSDIPSTAGWLSIASHPTLHDRAAVAAIASWLACLCRLPSIDHGRPMAM